MLSYQEFRQKITETVQKQLQEEIVVECAEMEQPSGEKREELVVYHQQRPRIKCGISMKQLYRNYQQTQDIEGLADDVSSNITANFIKGHMCDTIEQWTDWEWAKDKVILQLVNQEAEKEALAISPYNTFADMAIMARVAVEAQDDGLRTITVTHKLLSSYPVDKDTLFKIAMENTQRMFPSQIIRIDTMSDQPCCEEVGKVGLYALTNNTQLKGAITMFYPKLLQEFAKSKNLSGFYILPSSTTEVLIHVDEQTPIETMSALLKADIHEVNQQMHPTEVLSEHLYYYDATRDGVLVF